MFAFLTSQLHVDMRHESFLKNLSLMSLVLHEGLEGVSLWLTKFSSLNFLRFDMQNDNFLRQVEFLPFPYPFVYEWVLTSGPIQEVWDSPLYISWDVR